jgi:DNA polymerase-3 subunit gamma/tau
MHVALARKYRPYLFCDVVGQDMFIRILRNALAQGRLGNGLLLTGIRGVGKTTIARLVAKALCCTQRNEDQEPCNVCESCLALIQDKHVDILEMDAASHTGVDDIRQILESCQYRPLLGQYKVYIIDEVHMLSKSAFNALLKTLEEPPAHVKFIFATTDVAKVPPTIVSRCQQLSLNRVKNAVLVAYLGKIAEKEGFSLHPDALSLLARSSEGGVRDALSLLERVLVVSRAGQAVALEDVLDILGLPRTEHLQAILTGLEQAHVPMVLSEIATLYHQGVEPCTILTQLMALIHEKTMDHWKKSPVFDKHSPLASHETFDGASSSGVASGSVPSPALPIDRYDQWWQLGQKGLTELSVSPFPLLALEMLALRMAYMTRFPTPSQILSLIEPLHEKRSGHNASHGSNGPSNAPMSNPLPVSSRSAPVHSTRAQKPDGSTQLSHTKASQTHQSLHNQLGKNQAAEQPHTESNQSLGSPFRNLVQAQDVLKKPTSPSASPTGEAIGSLDHLLRAMEEHREGLLHAHIRQNVSWIGKDEGALVLHWDTSRGVMPGPFTASLEKFIQGYTRSKCRVIWHDQAQGLSQRAQEEYDKARRHQLAQAHPDMRHTLQSFPDAVIEEVSLV